MGWVVWLVCTCAGGQRSGCLQQLQQFIACTRSRPPKKNPRPAHPRVEGHSLHPWAASYLRSMRSAPCSASNLTRPILQKLRALYATVLQQLTWLGVESIDREPSGLTLSQAQPEPKRPAAAALNLAFISSTEPKDASIAAFTSPLGPLVLEGLVITCESIGGAGRSEEERRGWMEVIRR